MTSLLRSIPALADRQSRKFLGRATNTATTNAVDTSMAEPDAKASAAGEASAGPSKPQKPPNPVWRMMGAWFYSLMRNTTNNYRPAKLSLQAAVAQLDDFSFNYWVLDCGGHV
jgi:hypothetical protein